MRKAELKEEFSKKIAEKDYTGMENRPYKTLVLGKSSTDLDELRAKDNKELEDRAVLDRAQRAYASKTAYYKHVRDTLGFNPKMRNPAENALHVLQHEYKPVTRMFGFGSRKENVTNFGKLTVELKSLIQTAKDKSLSEKEIAQQAYAIISDPKFAADRTGKESDAAPGGYEKALATINSLFTAEGIGKLPAATSNSRLGYADYVKEMDLAYTSCFGRQ